MSNGKRWTIYVCPDCDGGLAPTPGSSDECDCPDGRDGDYSPLDKPVEVLPVSDLESLAQELEGRAQQCTGSEHATGKREAFTEAAQLVGAKIEEGGARG
jgi:hypothetical protein